MSEYIFVHLIDKQPVGDRLGHEIPLHMTLLHWFETDQPAEAIIQATTPCLEQFHPYSARAIGEDLFGPDKDVPVMRIKRGPHLLHMHLGLVAVVKGLGGSFDERWIGEDKWNPHVTHKKDKKLAAGDIIEVHDVDLISKDAKSGVRTILHRFDLT